MKGNNHSSNGELQYEEQCASTLMLYNETRIPFKISQFTCLQFYNETRIPTVAR